MHKMKVGLSQWHDPFGECDSNTEVVGKMSAYNAVALYGSAFGGYKIVTMILLVAARGNRLAVIFSMFITIERR